MNNFGVIEKIKQTSLVEYLSRKGFNPIESKGDKNKYHCPFSDHDDKTPSFYVDNIKGIYKCFGCERSGDILSFVQDLNSCDFNDAKEKLCNELGIHCGELGKKKDSEGVVIEWVNKIYKSNLKSDSNLIAKEYLKSRGVNDSSIDKFGIGVSGGLVKRAKINKDIMKSLGIILENESKNDYELFLNRLTFPLISEKGECLGFAGRIYKDCDQGYTKYINSKASERFDKSDFLYGLNEVLKSGRKHECIYVYEGYLDVILSNQVGINNTVACCGVALTEKHIEKLFKYTDNIVFVFDGDKAGLKALKRSINSSLGFVSLEKHVSYVLLGEKEDAAELIRCGDVEKLINLLKDFKGYEYYLLGKIASIKGRSEFVEKCLRAKEIERITNSMNGNIKNIAKEFLESKFR